MKKVILSLLFVNLFVITSCSSTNTNSSNNGISTHSSNVENTSSLSNNSITSHSSTKENTSYSSNDEITSSSSSKENTTSYISDDQSEIIDYPANSNYFINYESMRRYLSNEEGHKNDGYFYTLLPTNLDYHWHESYFVALDDKMEHNIEVIESYYIYDENLGTYKEPTKDVSYFTMEIKSVFYPVASDSTITTYKVESISESKIKVTLKSNDVIAGYIYIYYGELNATDYAIEYLKTNLKLV